MYKLRLLVFGLSVLNFVTSDENKTCEIAKSFAKSSPDNTVSVHCDADKSCAGFHCQGVYLINNAHLHIKKGDPVCFGAMINHCDTPLSMDVYYQNVLMNSSFQRRLHHNASIPIPGITLRTDTSKVDLFLFVEMTHKDNKVTIALTARVRFTVGKIVNWPDALNFKVIPEKTFPVPPCPPGENRNVTQIPVFPSCVAPTVVAPSTTTVKPMSKTYGKFCDPTKVYQCSQNEMCTFNKKCDCSTGMVLNPISGYCDNPGASPKHKLEPAVAETTIKSTIVSSNSLVPAVPQTAVSDPKKSNTGLITGLAVGAVAVLGIVILVSFLIWRSRSTHPDHVPIVDNEEVVI